MTLNLIETLETLMYSLKHTKNIKIYFMFSNFSKTKKYWFIKNKLKKYQCFMLFCIALFVLLRATQPN